MTPDEAIALLTNETARAQAIAMADMIRALVRERDEELVRADGAMDYQEVLRDQILREKHAIDEARKALRDLMPFVLEDYWPNCATPAYKSAVEAAKVILDGISGT